MTRARSHFLPYVLVAFAYISYALIFAAYHDYAETGLSSFLILPVIAGSWYFGGRGGILTAVLCILTTGIIQIVSGHAELVFTFSNFLRMVTTFFVSLLTSKFGTITGERREALSRLEELSEITRIILESRDLSSTLKGLVERIAHLFRADDAFFAFWDEEHEITTPLIAHGSMSAIYPTFQFEPGERTLSAAVMELGHPLAIVDLKSSTYFSARIASLFPSRSMLGIPLIVQGKKLATFYLGYNRKREFSPAEIAYAETAAQQIALVLMKTQLLDGAQKQVKQLTMLHEIATLATQVDSIDQLIERTTDIIGKNLFPDNFGILFLDEEKGILQVHPSYRFPIDDGHPRQVPLGQGITGQAAQTGQPIRIGNITTVPNYLDVARTTASELCVPIKRKDKVLGVINAESTRPDAFSLDDELLLGTLAGQLATAIEELRAKAAERRWLDQLAHSNELIHALAHITTRIENALSQDAIIQTLGDELNNIGITCAMAVHNCEQESFTIHYTSMAPEALHRLETNIGSPFVGYTFSLKKLSSILKAEDFLKPAVITSPEQQMQLFFPEWRKKVLLDIQPRMKVDPEVTQLRLLLVVEQNLLGILWLWSKTIIPADLPVMSTFAKQIAGALERARLFQEVQSLALTDPLTGLPNRRSLFELGKIEFARSFRTGRPFCCMMLDIDHFKLINDDYGHQTGDQVLRQFAERTQRSVRETDLIGRYGGEEIVIFLPETDSETAMQVAERLRRIIETRPFGVSEQELHITASIGVARKDEQTMEIETLIARADQALYVAKYKGRNRVALSV